MKYNTLSSSSLNSEARKSTLTIYTETDSSQEKIANNEAEIANIRDELEIVQRALKLQTRRCRQLVAEYTRRLQEKERQYLTEKQLRDNQLAKVLRALLIFEARLKQEQKLISHQLNEKDYIIKTQKQDICKLLSNQYCKQCSQIFSTQSNLESLDSSSEYAGGEYHDYQSSNFESLDSSSETYTTISEKDYNRQKSHNDDSLSGDDNNKMETESVGSMFTKNKHSFGRRGKKLGHRKSVGTYFEVLKLRNENFSPSSNDDNTSNDYENFDSLPSESVTDKISVVSDRIENIFSINKISNAENTEIYEDNNSIIEQNSANDSSSNISESDCNDTVIQKVKKEHKNNDEENTEEINKTDLESKLSKITEAIPVFDGDDGDRNDNWYASASDQEDDERRDMYRNNPVLECMNQILLQNINDSINSPPKTPNIERKNGKTKKVKFSDEEDSKNTQERNVELQKALENIDNGSQGNYYETPVQKPPNFYETPQSIYSNDYEQILSSKGSNKSYQEIQKASPKKFDPQQEKEMAKIFSKRLSLAKNSELDNLDNKDHYYVDMDKSDRDTKDLKIVRKNKILRTPPALPPKPANLLSKYKIQNMTAKMKEISQDIASIESEPDYCSISELNLPTNKEPYIKKINVVAEINAPNFHGSDQGSETQIIIHKPKIVEHTSHYDPVDVNNCIPKLVVSKNIEKFNIQIAKQTSIKPEGNIEIVSTSPKKVKQEPEIPKLPQVTEIIIPEENEEKLEPERINQDNYVKNNSQVLKLKTTRFERTRRPIAIGTSVSSLITGFNGQNILSEINQKAEKLTPEKRLASFENIQNYGKQNVNLNKKSEIQTETPNFETFDLSQNFEEFKLDECEIGEEYNLDLPDVVADYEDKKKTDETKIEETLKEVKSKTASSMVEVVRATYDIPVPQLNTSSIQLLHQQLEIQKSKGTFIDQIKTERNVNVNEPTYEHFLECTGLSSKSILTPSRLLSNHKSVLKPKDVKLRSKVRSTNIFERQGNTIKYWSEPYI